MKRLAADLRKEQLSQRAYIGRIGAEERPMADTDDSIPISSVTWSDEPFRDDLHDVDMLARSIREMGLVESLVLARERGGVARVVEGRRRLLALQKLGRKELRHGTEFLWEGEYLLERRTPVASGNKLLVPQGSGVTWPNLCVQCGQRAATTVEIEFVWRPFYSFIGEAWTFLANLMRRSSGPNWVKGTDIKWITLAVPVCERHHGAANLMRPVYIDATVAVFKGVNEEFLQKVGPAPYVYLRPREGAVILDLSRNCLGHPCFDVAACVSDLLNSGEKRVLLDLSRSDIRGDVQIAELVRAAARCSRPRSDGTKPELGLIHPSEQALELLKVFKLTKVFRVYPSEDDAFQPEPLNR